ncbi:methionine-R-sulfoxide reductase [Alloscardovia omnicolens]|uniref:peptide-methionine (S)-S-oxide reductase MsrA n=1 Tax=Alloscardovia omnicolens TaxID=419015 RepID=UPI000763EB0B|nr:peptide-methionine (S)-S-oxide reductase MsrA [Alloscardovia omnicolens]KWZ73619.1 methionine-R-sulfoxide reductase [Alloscardovia omnicolens]MDK8080774.1 peptide-methionine (S)-S-oxide reductase MsrA [Alloscardovia omnicolens]
MSNEANTVANNDDANSRVGYFAGGCFWGLEEYFKKVQGVITTRVGYANSSVVNPSYEQVCSGATGAAETVEVLYNPDLVSLRVLTLLFLDVIDPWSVNRQGNDVGAQYRSGLYLYGSDEQQQEQKDVFRTAIAQLEAREQLSGKECAVEVVPLQNFYAAEDYHQDYLDKNPQGYCHISVQAMLRVPQRQKYIERIWQLSNLSYAVTQNADTERPFANTYDRTFEPGIYVDIVSRKPLFVSSTKFDSGCGWPSFSKPINNDDLVEVADYSLFGRPRIEVRAKDSDIHLGHVFTDGPQDMGGLRYCMNSASLEFIPLEDLEEKGYGDLIELVLQGES